MILIVLILAVLVLAILLLRRRQPDSDNEVAGKEQIARAALELRNVSRRLDVAWTRHELRSESNKLRRELATEMSLIEALERDHSEEQSR
jgi:hypothetical protein